MVEQMMEEATEGEVVEETTEGEVVEEGGIALSGLLQN